VKLMRGVSAFMAAVVAWSLSAAAWAGVLNISFGAEDASQREGFKALVADFRAANPDVDARLTLVDGPSYGKTLATSLQGEGAPDVVNGAAGDPLRSLALHGDLDDLSDLWKANTWWNTFPSAAVTVAGRQFALPYQTYPWGLFTRRDVLERAGIREPPHDLSALMTACSKLRKAGFTPIALGAKDARALAAWFDFIDMRANGYDFHARLLDGKVAYTDSNVRRAFAMWKQLLDAKCFEPNAVTLDERAAQAQLYAGRAGMLLAGTVASTGFPEIVRAQIDYQRFPTIDSGQPPAEAAPTDTFQVAARARNKADARRFLKFAAGSAANAKLARSLGSFPANKFAPMAGTVLDLSAYKTLTDAKSNLVQGYERDVPADLAAQGMRGFQEFFANPDAMQAILDRLEATRMSAARPPAGARTAEPAGRRVAQ